MNRFGGRVRPAGDSSDEDEFADYVSTTEGNGPTTKNIPIINVQIREEERIFQLFSNGNLQEIRTLLDGGFDVNKRLRDDWTPLLLSASVGIPEVTAELISRGADVNMHRDYYTPLMAAAACPISTAAYEKSLLVVNQLLENKADVNAKTRKRMNALMYAATNGNCEVVKNLLPLCDKAAEDNQGWTALFWAVSANNIETVKLLLEDGFACDKFDVRGNLPIHYAQENEFTDIIEILPVLKNDKEITCTYNKYGYQDFFDNGRSDFIQDVISMLQGMKNERNIKQFLENEIDLLKFLAQNEEDLKNIPVTMPYERYRILNGLYRFHNYPFKAKALPIIGKSEPYSTVNVANTLLAACRQFVAMQASLRYILKNADNLNELRHFNKELERIREYLNKIKYVIDKVNLKVIEWDVQNKPADLISKNSCKKLKSSKIKYLYVFNILAVVAYYTWKKFK